MADKTIPSLQESTLIDGNALFPIDTGTQTYKLKFSNLIKSLIQIRKGVRVNTDYNALSNDRYIFAEGSGTVVTMPAASTVEGQDFLIKNIDSGGNSIGVAFNGAESVDGVTTLTLAERYQFVKIFSNGTSWDIVGW